MPTTLVRITTVIAVTAVYAATPAPARADNLDTLEAFAHIVGGDIRNVCNLDFTMDFEHIDLVDWVDKKRLELPKKSCQELADGLLGEGAETVGDLADDLVE
ncbi:hypothetical protein SMC26_13885 [Actinomadura fulvescens]|uniref:Uncharacterized protein n=1 Tax=Actinomadura fulvescens TaxID=46160 RepID=A0ABP6CCC1_9ACTN